MVTSTGLCQTNSWHFVDLIPKQRLRMVMIITNSILKHFFTVQKGQSSSKGSEQLATQERIVAINWDLFYFVFVFFSSCRELKMGTLIGSFLIKWLLLVALMSRAKWKMV